MLTPLPQGAPIGTFRDERGREVRVQLHPQFMSWLAAVQNSARTIGNSGPTSMRPVNSAAFPLFIGQDYFDTTLGVKVTVKSLNPTVWVNGAGTPV